MLPVPSFTVDPARFPKGLYYILIVSRVRVLHRLSGGTGVKPGVPVPHLCVTCACGDHLGETLFCAMHKSDVQDLYVV